MALTRRQPALQWLPVLLGAGAVFAAAAAAQPPEPSRSSLRPDASLLDSSATTSPDNDWLFPHRTRGAVTLFPRLSFEGGLASLAVLRRSATGSPAEDVDLYDATLVWSAAAAAGRNSAFSFSLLAGARGTASGSPAVLAEPGAGLSAPLPVGGFQADWRLGLGSSLRASIVGGADGSSASHYFEARLESVWRIAPAAELSFGLQHLDAAGADRGQLTALNRDAAVLFIRLSF